MCVLCRMFYSLAKQHMNVKPVGLDSSAGTRVAVHGADVTRTASARV